MKLFEEGQELSGQFVIEEEVSSGGQSIGFRARCDKKHFFIKQYKQGYNDSIFDARIQFYSEIYRRVEAVMARRLCLPIDQGESDYVPMIDKQDGQIYAVFPWIEGKTLTELITSQNLSDIERTRIVHGMMNICLKLAQKRIAHLDIKPDNFIVTTDGSKIFITLIDMDYARMGDEYDASLPFSGIAGLSLGGTECFRSPEQARGEEDKISSQSDVYSLAKTLIELFLGQDYFNPWTESELFAEHFTIPSQTPYSYLWLETLFKCLASDPQERPHMGRLFASMLESCGTYFKPKECCIVIEDGGGTQFDPYYFFSDDNPDRLVFFGKDLNPFIPFLSAEPAFKLEFYPHQSLYCLVPLSSNVNIMRGDRRLSPQNKYYLSLRATENDRTCLFTINETPIYIYLKEMEGWS